METMPTPTGKIVWFDFAIKNEAKSLPFFKSVLAWDFEPMGPDYWTIKCNGQTIGGLRKEKGTFIPANGGFVPYFNVPSLSEGKAMVNSNGGTLIGDTVAISEGKEGYFQNFSDLDGNTLALWSIKK